MSKTGNRQVLFDNIKGLLILLVVFAHCIFDYTYIEHINFIVVAIYCVHMPAFLFVSGYFSKSDNSRSKKVIVKFLLSYLIIISIYIIPDVIVNGKFRILSSYYSEWYLLALVIMRLIAPHLKKSKWTVVVLTCIAIISGYWEDLGGNSVLAIKKIVTFIPFFFAGYLVEEEWVNKVRGHGKREKIIGVDLLVFVILGIIISYRYIGIGKVDVIPVGYASASIEFALRRLLVFSIAAGFIISILKISIDREIPFLTKIGRNSFSIFLLHRPLTIVIGTEISNMTVGLGIFFTIVMSLILGSDKVSNRLNSVLDSCVDNLIGDNDDRVCRAVIGSFIGFILIMPVCVSIYTYNQDRLKVLSEIDPIYDVLSDSELDRFDNAIKVLFCGDLILLEDQVKNGYTGSGYDFNSMFEFTRKYIEDADFAIGVFEGPLGGAVKRYSQSNFDDGKELYLNFPDEFADAVKNAGFDLVTLATNHVLDMGREGKDRKLF